MLKFTITFHMNEQYSRKIEPANLHRRINLRKLQSANTNTFTVEEILIRNGNNCGLNKSLKQSFKNY